MPPADGVDLGSLLHDQPMAELTSFFEVSEVTLLRYALGLPVKWYSEEKIVDGLFYWNSGLRKVWDPRSGTYVLTQ